MCDGQYSTIVLRECYKNFFWEVLLKIVPLVITTLFSFSASSTYGNLLLKYCQLTCCHYVSCSTRWVEAITWQVQ